MNIILFGGNGYLGQNMQAELNRPGQTKTVHVWHPAIPIQAFHGAAFLHLACPRNKPGRWDWRLAEAALEDGVDAAQLSGIPARRCWYASSFSVFDQPDNEYARFKRFAERFLAAKGWNIFRLPTLFGGNPVRADLGLHQIAKAAAEEKKPYVAHGAVRHVMHVRSVAYKLQQITSTDVSNGGSVAEITDGWVPFSQIVARDVPRQHCRGMFDTATIDITCTYGHPMYATRRLRLRADFEALVRDIRAGKVEFI